MNTEINFELQEGAWEALKLFHESPTFVQQKISLDQDKTH
jgi:hypothetical protein